MSASPIVQLSAAIGIVATGPSGDGSSSIDDIAEGHLVEPALLAIGAEDQPVGAVLLEQLDLVALVEEADLRAAQLIGRVEQAHDPIADDPALAAVERPDETLVEGQPRRRRGVADRIGLAGLEERRPPPARHERLHLSRFQESPRRPPRCVLRVHRRSARPRSECERSGDPSAAAAAASPSPSVVVLRVGGARIARTPSPRPRHRSSSPGSARGPNPPKTGPWSPTIAMRLATGP